MLTSRDDLSSPWWSCSLDWSIVFAYQTGLHQWVKQWWCTLTYTDYKWQRWTQAFYDIIIIMHVYVSMCMYICMMCTFVCMTACVCTIHRCTYIFVHTYLHTYIQHTYTHVHKYIHICTYTYMHAHTHKRERESTKVFPILFIRYNEIRIPTHTLDVSKWFWDVQCAITIILEH